MRITETAVAEASVEVLAVVAAEVVGPHSVCGW
jgi:hypothetical protein